MAVIVNPLKHFSRPNLAKFYIETVPKFCSMFNI